MSKQTGGPAFPGTYSNVENQGLTMRDYFAAKSVPGLIAAKGLPTYKECYELFASHAYRIADALIKERSK